MNQADFLLWTQRKDAFMRSSRSPLPERLRPTFGGLQYHPYDPDLEFLTEPLPDPERQVLVFLTSSGSEVVYERFGWFTTLIEGQTVRLAGFAREGDDQPESLFVPFKDTSSGFETYGGGRYLDVPLHNGRLEVNFNFAYNPYCAFGDGWSCPIPPQENCLTVAVLAGELNFVPNGNNIGIGENETTGKGTGESTGEGTHE